MQLDLIALPGDAYMLVRKDEPDTALAWILPLDGAYAVHSRDGFFDIFHIRRNAVIAAIRACHNRTLRRAA